MTSPLAVWKALVQAAIATSWEVAPPPTRLPLSAGPEDGFSEPAGVLFSFAAQPARARAATAPMAVMRAIREIFAVDPFYGEMCEARFRAHSDVRRTG